MAESKRRGEDAADERLDEASVEAVDDDTQDDDVDDFAAESKRRVRAGRSAAATRDRVKAEKSSEAVKSAKRPKAGAVEESVSIFGRIARFIREVVAELRKVNWPSRNELLTYTSVVIVFVVIMMSIVAGLDFGFAWAVGKVFGGK